jgi:hypothetical protein
MAMPPPVGTCFQFRCKIMFYVLVSNEIAKIAIPGSMQLQDCRTMIAASSSILLLQLQTLGDGQDGIKSSIYKGWKCTISDGTYHNSSMCMS